MVVWGPAAAAVLSAKWVQHEVFAVHFALSYFLFHVFT